MTNLPNYQYEIKLFLDKIISIFLLTLLSPLLLLISTIIKFDSSGPVFFRQNRLGYRGSVFSIYKFRTMKTNSIDIRNPDGTTFNDKNDQRVTKIGKLLRSTSTDELPQIINILKGEMSFIGPRPDLPEFLDKYSDDQRIKLKVLPGITGLAQVNGRNEIPLELRLAYDKEYVNNYSLKMDLIIAIKTIKIIFQKKGIYIKN